MRMRVMLILALGWPLAACSAAAPGPDAPVKSLYAPYVTHSAERQPSNWDAAPVYSRAFKAKLDRAFEYSRLLNEPVIDFDPIANGQDFSIANLQLSRDGTAKDGKARIVARFDNLGQPTTVSYEMIREQGGWKIDAIRDGEDDLGGVIAQALKPIGAPEAMKAPVAQVYEMIAPPHNGAQAPIYKWGPLTKAFARALQAAGGRKSVAGDALTGGQDISAAAIGLEAASGAVIARLASPGQKTRTIVYDVVEEDGAWKIDDIRAPLDNPAWDLRAQLETPPD